MDSVLGCDVSLNHGAFVLMIDGKVADYRFYSDKKGIVAAGRGKGYLVDNAAFKKMADGDKKFAQNLRLHRLRQIFDRVLLDLKPEYACVEDYAYSAKSASTYQIGEGGGQMREACMELGVKLRLHEPGTVKMFVAHNARAEKEEMTDAVATRWQVRFPAEIDLDYEGDLSDAYGLAKLLETELELRAGRDSLEGKHEKEIQVFNRVSKEFPLNVLVRPFIWLHPTKER